MCLANFYQDPPPFQLFEAPPAKSHSQVFHVVSSNMLPMGQKRNRGSTSLQRRIWCAFRFLKVHWDPTHSPAIWVYPFACVLYQLVNSFW